MSRLFSAEMRKVWQNRFFLLSIAVLLCTNLFLLWFHTNNSQGVSPVSYRRIEQQIAGMDMPATGAFLHAAQERTVALVQIENVLRTEAYNNGARHERLRAEYAKAFEDYYEVYQAGGYLQFGETLAEEYRLLDTLIKEFDTVDRYEDFLASIEENARQLSSISIFSNSKNDYDIKTIEATARAYRDMSGRELHYYPQKGLLTALDFELTDVITVFVMVLIGTVLVRTERDNGLLALVRSAPAGRLKTACAKLLALAASLLVILTGLYAVNLAYCNLLYGIGPLDRAIQSVPFLMRSTWKLTVGEYLAFFLLAKWAAAAVCGMWVMLAMLIPKRMLTGVFASLAFIAANLLIRTLVSATSYWNILKYANLVSLLRTNELLGTYQNLYCFGRPVPLLFTECAAAAIFGLLFLMAFCLVFSRHYFSEQRQRGFSFALRKKGQAFTTPFRQELSKLLVMQGGAALLILFAGFQLYTAVTTQSYMEPGEIYYRYYMKNVEGPLSKESIEWMNEENKKFQPIYRLNAALDARRITGQEYQSRLLGYGSLQEKMNVFQRVAGQMQSMSERPRMQMIYETGWLKLFDYRDTDDLPATLWTALLCALCFSGQFALEKQTGMIKVISATPLGRETTAKCKLRLATALCGVLTVLSLLPRLWVVLRDYGLGAWFAPVYSINEYAAAPEIPMFMMFGLLLLTRFAAMMLMAHVTLTLSERIGNTFGTLFISLLLFALAPLLSIAGLTQAKWCSCYTLLHICALVSQPGGVLLFFLLIAVCGGACFCCQDYLLVHFGRNKR